MSCRSYDVRPTKCAVWIECKKRYEKVQFKRNEWKPKKKLRDEYFLYIKHKNSNLAD